MSSKNGFGTWSRHKTFKLIESIEKHPGLWNGTLEFRDRDKKARVMREIAASLQVDEAEMNRKWHNLRCQMNAEIRKKKKKFQDEGSDAVWHSSWQYYDALFFVVKSSQTSHFEEQPYQELEFKTNKKIKLEPVEEEEEVCKKRKRIASEKHEPAKPVQEEEDANRTKIIVSEKFRTQHHPEEKDGTNSVDDCTVFGDFVAAELRQLHSNERRRKLKRIIQKAIIAIGEEEDLELSTTMQVSSSCSHCSTNFNFVAVDEASSASSENPNNYITLSNFYDNVDRLK